ncbi:MIP family Ig-specific serine endopeptidase [Mycoplasma sp. 1573]
MKKKILLSVLALLASAIIPTSIACGVLINQNNKKQNNINILEKQIQDLKNQTISLSKKLATNETEKSNLLIKISDLNKLVNEYKNNLITAQEKLKDNEDKSGLKIQSYQSTIDDLKAKILLKDKEIEQLKDDLDDVKKTSSTSESHTDNKDIQLLKAQVDNLNKILKHKDELISELKKQISAKNIENNALSLRLNTQIIDLNTEIKNKDQLIEILKKQLEETKHSNENDENAQIAQLKFTIQTLIEQVNTKDKEILKAKQELEALKTKDSNYLKQISDLQQKLTQLKTEKDSLSTQLNTQITQYQNQINTIQEQNKNLQNQLNLLQQTNKQQGENIKSLQQTITQNQDAISSLEEKLKDYNQIQQKNLDLEAKILELNKQIENFKKQNNTDSEANSEEQTFDAVEFFKQHPEEKQYQETSENRPVNWTNEQYVQKIVDQSFSLMWDFQDGTNTAGTVWVLDYKKLTDSKYTFYFATNYHVALELYQGDKDFKEYQQLKRTNTITNIRLLSPKNWKDNSSSNTPSYLLNLPKDNWPRIFFLAQNFMDSTAMDYNQNPYHYADFAVIEWTVDLNELSAIKYKTTKQDALEFRRKLLRIVNNFDINPDVDTFINATKTDKLLSLDYSTANDIKKSGNVTKTFESALPTSEQQAKSQSALVKKYLHGYQYNSSTDNVYWAGFPLVNGIEWKFLASVPNQYLATNNVNKEDGVTKSIFTVQSLFHNQPIASHGAKFNESAKSLYYGLSYGIYQKVGPVGGVSGGMVLNAQMMPIGLIYGNQDWYDLQNDDGTMSKYSLNIVQPFTQQKDIYTENGIAYAFNLIDGTDKQKYPHQTSSYREQLIAKYGSNYKTKLFK